MSKQDNLTDFLTDVADAIRAKKGSSEKINPQNFSEEIRSIESGGEVTEVKTFGEVMVDNTGDGKSIVRYVAISEGVTSISDNAYTSCQIQSIHISEGVIKLGRKAFMACGNLEQVTIPRSVTFIGYSCFENCSSLAQVSVLGDTDNIEGDAFWGCTKMSSITFFEATKVPTMGNSNVFRSCPSSIVVPDNLYDEWIVSTNWSTYADRIVKASEYQPNNE